MGGAIACGLAQGTRVATSDIVVSNPSQEKLNRLKAQFPDIQTTHSNAEAAKDADIIILAVKPWVLDKVLMELPLHKGQTLVSVVAGRSFDEILSFLHTSSLHGRVPDISLFRVIPNTAAAIGQSMTLVSSLNATPQQQQLIMDMLAPLGPSMLLPEEQLAAATSLTSCGIAYVLKYAQAAMQASTELGIRPADSLHMVAQTLKGAAELLLNNHEHPAVEIDKVCTPGGLTIKGINELEHGGFSSAVIKALKASAV